MAISRDSSADARVDVLVLGAGPAGLAAATAAVHAGARVTVVDAGPTPGGQYWRHPPGSSPPGIGQHPTTRVYRMLAETVRARTRYLSGHDVWAVERDDDGFAAHTVHEGAEVTVHARRLVLATGAHDRSLPFPGWDLPGVYSAGGAQSLWKGHRVTIGPRVAVGGTGPFLLPVAADLAAHGARVVGVFEANHPRSWSRHLPAVTSSVGTFLRGAGHVATLSRHRVRPRVRHAVVAAHGDDHVEAVTVVRLTPEWTVVPGSSRVVECDAVAVGWGFTPRLELPLALGCTTRLGADGSLVVRVDDHQATDVTGVYAAGEVCGVGGAALAVVEGELAGLAAAGARAVPDRDRLARLLGRRAQLRRFAQAIHEVYPVRPGWLSWLRPDTLVCRCEEVTVATVTNAVHELGATDARSVKLLTRAGMGWCQGRMCGTGVAALAGAEAGTAATPHAFAERPVATPIPLGLLGRVEKPPLQPGPAPVPSHNRKDRPL
ncbi:NAD(P)/FAD-dependent oxidoreductase [Phytoactinopolyspora limicola]|uniref:FAD/NAD(P)-dependent oxidoreductase n=1 Tax=Phytoactinopolyspora limicola TaxID=2715536 RepID=UPI00140B5DD6|nr:NAD(P)/FAD-dependent oxidoreductase [Phytoactinopolyspora limicola]